MSEPPNQLPTNWPTGYPPPVPPEQGMLGVPLPPYPYPAPLSYPLYPPPPELPDAYFPTGQSQQVDYPPYAPYAPYAPIMMAPYVGPLESPSRGGGLAITGFVLGIVSIALTFLFFILGAPVAIAGIIFSSFGIRSRTHRGLAIAGLVINIVSLLLTALLIAFFVILLVAAPR